jgi:hypothetical protein
MQLEKVCKRCTFQIDPKGYKGDIIIESSAPRRKREIVETGVIESYVA